MKLAGMLLWALLFTTTCSLADTQDCKEFVGWLIYPTMKTESPSAQELHCPNQNKWVLSDSRNQVLAEMVVPSIPSELSLNYGDCRIEGVWRHDVIAIVKHDKKKEWSGEIKKAWELRISPPGFLPIKPRNMTCRNEEFGI